MFESPGAIAFDLGFLQIHWYGIIIATAFISGVVLSSFIAKSQNENPDNIADLSIYLLLGALIVSRLYYVAFNWDYYANNLLEIFQTWHGGLTIHGAIIGGIIAGSIYVYIKKLNWFKYADIISYGLIVGQAIGRWGNFFNSEAFGTPTQLPWKLYISPENRPEVYANFQYFHPTFLYESLWNILVFCILFFIVRKISKNYSGTVFFAYLILYSIGRLLIESIRTDNIYSVIGFHIAQIASLVCILAGIIGIIWIRFYKK